MRAARTWRGYPIPPSKSFHPSSYGYTASQQRNQQSRQRLRQQVAAPKVTGPVLIGPPGTPGVPSVKSGGPHVVLQHIVFTPSRFLTKAELNKLAAGYLHRSITLADLYALVTKINALYAKRELITDRAFLPPQHITHGQVTIQLVEGRVGRIELHGQPYTRRAILLARLPVHRGQVLDAPALKDALEYFNRTNSLGLRAQLRPGESFGLSDVLLNVLEPPRYQLNVLANNEGAASTGRGQLGLYGVFNGPLRRGDSLSLYYMRSRGAYNYDVQYSVPLDTHGLKLSLSASHDNIHIIAGPYEALEIRGSGDQQGVTLSQALLRGPEPQRHAHPAAGAGSFRRLHAAPPALEGHGDLQSSYGAQDLRADGPLLAVQRHRQRAHRSAVQGLGGGRAEHRAVQHSQEPDLLAAVPAGRAGHGAGLPQRGGGRGERLLHRTGGASAPAPRAGREAVLRARLGAHLAAAD